MTDAAKTFNDINDSFDSWSLARKIEIVLDADMRDIRQQARAFIADPARTPLPVWTSKEEHREKTLEWVRDMVKAGFTKLPYASAYGGGDNPKAYINIAEMIGHQDLSLATKQGVQFGLFGLSVSSLGTDKHHEQYMRDIMAGKLLGGFAMTEVGGGSDVQGVETEAVYDHATRSFTIHSPTNGARKAYIGNAATHGTMMVVFAQLKMSPGAESEGVHAFMVPIRDAEGHAMPGVTIDDCGHKVGLNGIDNGYLSFDRVQVGYDAMLDRFASIDEAGQYQSPISSRGKRFFTMIGTLVTGRIFVSMAALSGAKNTLKTAVDFAATRKVFGDTLLEKQATQARVIPHLASVYALHFATRLLTNKQQQGAADLETAVAAIKAMTTEKAIDVVDEMRRLAGGAGFMSDERYGAIRSDLDIFRTFEGDNTVLRFLVAKNRLSGLTAQFNGVSGAGKMIKAASMAIDHALSRVGAAKGRTSADHILDPAFQRDIFARREKAMLYNLSRKIMKLAKTEGGFAKAVNKCQIEMAAYADAYAEKVVLDEFTRVVAAQTDPAVKGALQKLCDVYALNTMRKNALWYVENGYMSTAKTKAIAAIEQKLYDAVQPDLQALTAAFGIPDNVLYPQQAVLAKYAQPGQRR